jgi:battenin
MPFVIPITYYFLLPRPTTLLQLVDACDDGGFGTSPTAGYAPLPTDPTTINLDEEQVVSSKIVQLTASDKWRLARPMLLKYMLPLCELILLNLLGVSELTSFSVCVYLVSLFFLNVVAI